jgi:putative transcriptional regulator
MTITHHPDLSTLMSCAAGSQPEALAAVVASHISMCPTCAAELERMQEIGVALFDTLEPRPVSRQAPIIALRAAEAETGSPAPACHAGNGDVPSHLAPFVGHSLDRIAWRRIGPGIWDYRIPLSKGSRGDLRLVKVAPGNELPEHGHRGEELTLLLRGGYSDETGTYDVGDLADLDDSVDHKPVADPVEGCICLIASEKKARFKSFLARLMQPIIGI